MAPPRLSCLALLLLIIATLQIVFGKEIKIIQDDWSHHSNGLYEPVYARAHRVQRKGRSAEMEREPEPSHVMVVRRQNRTLYVELEPAEDLWSPLANLSHASGFFRDSRCLFRGKVLNQGGGHAAVSLCRGPQHLSGLLVTPEGPVILRPLEEDNEVEGRRRKRSAGPLHALRHFNHNLNSFCAQSHQQQESSWPLDLEQVRNRRSTTNFGRKVIETAVFADSDLYLMFKKKHGEALAAEQLTNMIMAIMNEVQLIYMYDSMKTSIKIVIVKLEILKPGDDAPDQRKGDIDQYLDTFCAWQAQKVAGQGLPGHWDHAIMLTGMNLYKELDGKKNDKVLGLAWVNGMCRPTYSCTINEGKDFEAAYVIAHELAHSLGVLHDGTGNNCDPDKYIMSDKTGPGKISWSDCSNQYMQRYFNRGHARCLDEDSEPSNVRLRLGREIRPPGERYGPEEQCHLAMGPRYKPYTNAQEPFNNICRELWCYTGSWATPAHPALDGSRCSKAGRCQQGKCQPERQADGQDTSNTTDSVSAAAPEYTGPQDDFSTVSTSVPRPDERPRGFINAVSTFFRDVLKKVQGFFKTTPG